MTSTPSSRTELHANPAPRVAIVTMGVKLGNETRGYTRFRMIAELLSEAGFRVDLFTSSFQHWDKAQRDTTDEAYQHLPYQIHFIPEPGYKKNLDLGRIYSHRCAAKNLRPLLEEAWSEQDGYKLIYAEIPPNDVARVCAEVAHAHDIPFVADVNDLWPEAMRMAIDIPVLSSLAFAPFARDAKKVYELLSACVGTSDEYAARPAQDRATPYERHTVYVGNDLAAFDEGVATHGADITKPDDELWLLYTGTLGKSYDLVTLIRAAALYEQKRSEQSGPAGVGNPRSLGGAPLPPLRVKILGDGPTRQELESLANDLQAPVDFLGYTPYDLMAAYLHKGDITINSLIASAPQSIVTKIGDYLASESAMINTGSSPEFRNKVTEEGFGVNIKAEDPQALCMCIQDLASHPSRRKVMAAKGRKVAEEQFDQRQAYQTIVSLVQSLT